MLNLRLEKKKKKGSINDIMSRRELLHQARGDSVDSWEYSLPQILAANERNFMVILHWGKISPCLP